MLALASEYLLRLICTSSFMKSKSSNRISAVPVTGGPALHLHAYPPQLTDNGASNAKFVINAALLLGSAEEKIQKPVKHPKRKEKRVDKHLFHPSMACINTLQSCSMFKGAGRRGKASGGKGSPTFGCRASTFMDGNGLRLGLDENPDAIISGEWPENFSLLSYDDLRAYLESQQPQPAQMNDQQVALLRETMSTPVLVARAEQTLEDVACHFEAVSGLPVVDSTLRCIGVVVKSDWARASHGSKTKIAEVMTSPAITLASDKTVMDAAAVMLKKKIHRLPIVNQDNQVIGIVTRDDVLRGLEAMLKI